MLEEDWSKMMSLKVEVAQVEKQTQQKSVQAWYQMFNLLKFRKVLLSWWYCRLAHISKRLYSTLKWEVAKTLLSKNRWMMQYSLNGGAMLVWKLGILLWNLGIDCRLERNTTRECLQNRRILWLDIQKKLK